MFRESNYVLTSIKLHSPAPGLHIDFSKRESSSQINGVLMTVCIRVMLDVKYYLYL